MTSLPQYTVWQGILTSVRVAMRALEEARATALRPGRIPRVTEWQDGVHYEGAVVAHLGETWQARRDTGRPPPHDDWICLAARGLEGASPAYKGAWKAATAYQAHDVAMVDGSSFVALRDAPGPCPGDGWRLLAGRGKSGPPGPPGASGERGWPGLPGNSPVSLSLDDDGLLTMTMSDGTRLTCDFYPVLSRIAR